jgi:hypothetical protein
MEVRRVVIVGVDINAGRFELATFGIGVRRI